MRTFFLLLCTTVFSFTTENTFSQEKVVIDQDQTVTVDKVFKIIKEQTNYRFIYPSKLFENAPKIQLTKGEIEIQKLLNQSLSGSNLNFEVSKNNTIIIKENTVDLVSEIQQGIQISGTVVDGSGLPLPGANIIVKGTGNGTQSDFDGNFSLTVASSSSAILVVSYVGYTTREVPLEGKKSFIIVLRENASALEEVVVVGYGTLKKDELTSSVSKVSSKEFNSGNINDIGQLIQGKVAGLSISLNSGDPTANTQVRLRGASTLLGSNTNPLILIDGVPGDFNTVAPQDIESISVLKDGSAAAIYGTRGTNGVILVTTKRASGTYGSKVTYSASVSTQQITSQLDMLTAKDYKNQIEEGTRDASYDMGFDTNWLDEITQTPISHIHNLTFRGGDFKTNYLATLNIRKLEGIFLKSDNSILTGRVDINHSMLDDKLHINLGYLIRKGEYTTTADGGSFNGYTYRQSLIRYPTSPARYEDGSWDSSSDISNFNYDNPLGRIYESDGQNRNNFNRLNGKVEYNPWESLKLTSLISFSRFNETRGYAESKNHISNSRGGVNGYVSNGTRETEDKLLELTAQYSLKVDNHSLNLLGGYSYQDNFYRDYWMTNNDFQSDLFGYHNIGLGLGIDKGSNFANIGSTTSKTNLISFFNRVNYNFDNKYLLQASLRYEAASQLYKTKNPWGAFPAVSAGWRISNESFMENVNFINDLKIRVGYGVTGTPNSNGFGAVALLGYGSYFYYNGEWIRTLVPSQNENPHLKWEEKHEINYGLDFEIIDNKISGSVDFYKRNVKDLLYDYSVPTPPNLYPTTRANAGELENKGVEILVNATPVKTSNFEWNTSINFSKNKSKLVSLSNDLYQTSSDYFYSGGTGEPVQTFTHIVEVGQSIGNFYGFKVVDIDENGYWIYETPEGEIQNYNEFSHATEDKQILGNGLPKYYAGWNNSFRYKNFDLSITMRGAFDYQILNFERMYLENPTIQYYNRLKSSQDLVYNKSQLAADLEYNSYYIEEGDFWKIDNITLGYNFKDLGKNISSARIYVSTLNTLTITGYKGIDPEVDRGGLTPGNDNRDKYPTARTFTLGIDVSF